MPGAAPGPLRRSALVVLDVCAWKDYFRTEDEEFRVERVGLADARRRLVRAKEAGLVRPLLTIAIQSEMMQTCGAEGFERYARLARFAWNASGARVLANPDDREEGELRRRRRLPEREMMIPRDARQAFRATRLLDEAHVRAMAAIVAKSQQDNEAEELAKRAATIQELDARDAKARESDSNHPDWRSVVLADDASREELVLSWAHDEMVAVASRIGLPIDGLPDPRTLPSFYFPKLVHVTRLHGILIRGLSPKQTDVFDTTALQDAAAYADAFVTSDRRLLGLARRTPLGSLRVLDWGEWDEYLRASLMPQ